MQVTKDNAADETEELARFRQQWLEEVRSKKKVQSGQAPAPTNDPARDGATTSSTSSAPHDAEAHPSTSPHRPAHRRVSHGASSSPPPVHRKAHPGSVAAQLGPSLQLAVDVYRRAVQHEQRSELDDALRLYRTAFRMDPNVDRAYHLIEDELYRAAAAAHPRRPHHQKAPSTGKADAVDGVAHEMQALDISRGHVPVPVAHARGEGFVSGTLASLVAAWPVELAFEPEDEKESVPLEMLPDELLVIVLRLVDHTALERFARVNRKARVITLDASIWRPMVKTIYQPPQIADEEEVDDLVTKYMMDYRRVYIEHPRVRFDGVYIAVCHYIRNGVGENVWVNYTHLITYYRYLRFYPDGQVLSLLTNEEQTPSHVIPLLKPSLRAKGFLIGTWYLDGTELHIEDLLDPGSGGMRYSFQMILDLRSRPLGRWNRLDLRTYDSVHLESGEATPLALKNERPFWFSKVRSYA